MNQVAIPLSRAKRLLHIYNAGNYNTAELKILLTPMDAEVAFVEGAPESLRLTLLRSVEAFRSVNFYAAVSAIDRSADHSATCCGGQLAILRPRKRATKREQAVFIAALERGLKQSVSKLTALSRRHRVPIKDCTDQLLLELEVAQ